MLRTLLTLLAMAQVAFCPLFCWGGFDLCADCAVGDSGDGLADDCCGETSSPPPTLPVDICGSYPCFCHGAPVEEAGASMALRAADLAQGLIAPPCLAPQRSVAARTVDLPAHCWGSLFGVELRLMIASLLL